MLFSALVLGSIIPAAAQRVQISVETGLQHSLIPDQISTEQIPMPFCPGGAGTCTVNTARVEDAFKDKPTGYLKGLLLYSVNPRVQLYHNLNLNLIRYKHTVKVHMNEQQQEGSGSSGGGWMGSPSGDVYNGCFQYDENGQVVSVPCQDQNNREFQSPPADERIGNTSILYLTQEMGARYKVASRLWVYGGVDISYRLYSQFYEYKMNMTYKPTEEGGDAPPWGTPRNGGSYEVNYSVEKNTSGDSFRNLLLGVQAGAAYELNDNFALTTAFQRDMGHNSRKASHLVRLGVQYRLKSWW